MASVVRLSAVVGEEGRGIALRDEMRVFLDEVCRKIQGYGGNVSKQQTKVDGRAYSLSSPRVSE